MGLILEQQVSTMGLILEHFLLCFLKYLLTDFEGPAQEKISVGFMNAWKCVRSCALILKLNARSRAPEFSYRNAPPAPYKGMQLKILYRQSESNFRLVIKIMSKWKASTGQVNANLTSPVQRLRHCCRM